MRPDPDRLRARPQKKGAQAQKQIAMIKQQQSQAQTPDQKRKAAEKEQREKEKKAAEEARREAAELFKPVQTQKVPFGVDPKTVLCIFYKKGICEKGRKCKFSHDLAIERKAEKKDLYSDTREQEKAERERDDMTEWDEGALRSPTRLGERNGAGLFARRANDSLQPSSGRSSSASTATRRPRRKRSASTSSRPSKTPSTAGSGRVRMVRSACTNTVYRPGKLSLFSPAYRRSLFCRSTFRV